MSPVQGTDEWSPIYSGVRWDITERRQCGTQSLHSNAALSPTRNFFAEPPDAACKTARLWILRKDHGAGCAGELRLGIHRSSLPAPCFPTSTPTDPEGVSWKTLRYVSHPAALL